MDYPKRLIEVDLPIKEISAHARREKSIRHGHISTLHIWWARRPLAACRAVLCASLWLDPADKFCPKSFRISVSTVLSQFAKQVRSDKTLMALCQSHWTLWNSLNQTRLNPDNEACYWDMRTALLAFIADFANWDASTNPAFLQTARALTQAAHEALGGEPGSLPLVVDPFAGGGSIPLEALRIGADAYASDLNPVAVLLNKVLLEYIPKYGQRLADEVRRWGDWISLEAEKELAEFYPPDSDGAVPIAYLWARTIVCEGCGAEVPLMRSLWLAKKAKKSVALRLVPKPDDKRVDFEIIENIKASDVGEGTVKRGSASCPCCGVITPVASVRQQLKPRRGGAADARLFCVVTTRSEKKGRFYRLPTERDLEVVRKAGEELERRKQAHQGELSLVPDEPLPPQGALGFRVQLYGMEQWGDLFSPRQLLALTTLVNLVRKIEEQFENEDKGFVEAVRVCLGLAIDRQADYLTSLVIWANTGEFIAHTFGRQALPMVWEWPECNLFVDTSGNWRGALNWICLVIEANISDTISEGQAENESATNHPYKNQKFVQCFFTDPPYYDNVPYADLSDFFYVWLRRTIKDVHPQLFANELVPKNDECIVDEVKGKDKTYFEQNMEQAMENGCSMLEPNGIGVVVFAHKSTTGWETMLNAMIQAGWIITASWSIDTERSARLRAHDSAALASSIHLVCRQRPNKADNVGDYRTVLEQLNQRVKEWLPRLNGEGIVGADAIFACIGPAMEIFSRYDSVEKVDGTLITLKAYLEQVWATVSKEALSMIFSEIETTGLEEDARLTAIWLWTLSTETSTAETVDDEEMPKKVKATGYVLEYDAARKLAQGLGAHLDKLEHLVYIKGSEARLLPVTERARYLFGKPETAKTLKKTKKSQTELFALPEDLEVNLPTAGNTTLDRIHQCMLLFAEARSEALKRFIQEIIGTDVQVWKLANALSALYPKFTDEKRWVDGVLARKKGLG
ncbi:MAG TPA: DUF1156 domain-containing protein [Thioploca sp.]|nr:DUF1156 domain-containing protein [Thioploca sp.]